MLPPHIEELARHIEKKLRLCEPYAKVITVGPVIVMDCTAEELGKIVSWVLSQSASGE